MGMPGEQLQFQFDHFEEMGTYCDVMNRLLKELDVMRGGQCASPSILRALTSFAR